MHNFFFFFCQKGISLSASVSIAPCCAKTQNRFKTILKNFLRHEKFFCRLFHRTWFVQVSCSRVIHVTLKYFGFIQLLLFFFHTRYAMNSLAAYFFFFFYLHPGIGHVISVCCNTWSNAIGALAFTICLKISTFFFNFLPMA